MAVSNEYQAQSAGSGCFKEAVCIDTKRIYDSCSDKNYARYTYQKNGLDIRFLTIGNKKEAAQIPGELLFCLPA